MNTERRLQAPATAVRRVRLCCLTMWATGLESVSAYLGQVQHMDIRPFVTKPDDEALLRKARLDCDWYAENGRCFDALSHPTMQFLPAWTTGPAGLLELVQRPRELAEERWFVLIGQRPQQLGALAARTFALLRKTGVKIAYYAFDEASRFMPCFREIAPFLDVLIHDEAPLDPAGERALSPQCVRLHRSWVANVVPFAAPFNPEPEKRIVFLGSQLGLTPHRQRQIEFLKARFKDRFISISDHSLAVGDRFSLNRYAVSLCPEGRKFGTPGMSQTHTDRPFWSGCLGLVPVSEDSSSGGRLDELSNANLIVRYPHGDLEALAECCEKALSVTTEDRRRIYEHFNRHETVGTVLADAIARASPTAT